MSRYILWLASWYPSQVDPFNGDFIERHAKAVSAFIPVKVIYVVKDPALKAGEVRAESEENGQLSVYRTYYNTLPGVLGKLSSIKKYISLHKKVFDEVNSRFGEPALVHVHVAMKAGLFAQYLHKEYGIRYIVSEHWSGYYQDNELRSIHRMHAQKKLTERILNQAHYVLPVSKSLGKAIFKLSNTPQVPIPNVVDTSLFYEAGIKSQEPVFVHVSNMAPVKNAGGIIRAAVELHEEGHRFRLMMVGAAPGPLMDLVRSFDALEKYIFFIGAVPYAQVPEFLHEATALVLFSNFETQSCVALEALCCGVPVIAPSVGGLPEVINELNGIFIEKGDENALKDAMRSMLSSERRYDHLQIAHDAQQRFSYEKVGRKIVEVYEKCGVVFEGGDQ